MELDPKTKTFIVAHRGASYKAPENTIPSFQLAFKEDADFIEGDFWLTKDNEIVCIHDQETSRVTAGRKKLDVRKSTLSELKRLDAGSWKSEEYKGVTIPTLDEIFQVIPEGRGIYIEIKDFREIFVKKLAETIEEKSVPPELIRIITFDRETVRFAGKYLPSIKTYWLFSWYSSKIYWINSFAQKKIIRTVETLNCGGIDVNAAPYVDNRLAELFKEKKMDLCAYDVSDVDEAVRLINLGVHAITTDSPLNIRKGIKKQIILSK